VERLDRIAALHVRLEVDWNTSTRMIFDMLCQLPCSCCTCPRDSSAATSALRDLLPQFIDFLPGDINRLLHDGMHHAVFVEEFDLVVQIDGRLGFEAFLYRSDLCVAQAAFGV